MEKITYEDMFALLDEIEYGIKDKTRSLNNIDNLTVKKILTNESNIALKSGMADSIIASGASIAAGTLVGTLGGAGTGIVTSGLTTLGATLVWLLERRLVLLQEVLYLWRALLLER